jgi:glycosyltransferase involved in cell wall biosynthesis
MAPPAFAAPIKVAYIGRLAPVKGFNEYLALARALRRSNNAGRFEFHLIGDGDPPQRELANAAAAAGDVIYHGGVDNDQLPAALRDIDACVALTFVQSAGSELSGGAGVSNALLEQIAAGRLIICWDNAAFRQVLDSQSAFLVPQGDEVALRAAFEEIANAPNEALWRAECAASLADQYSFTAHLDKFAALANKLAPHLFAEKTNDV